MPNRVVKTKGVAVPKRNKASAPKHRLPNLIKSVSYKNNNSDSFSSLTGAGGAAAFTDPVKQYATALRDPFTPFVEGVRTPDQFSLPTEAVHIRGKFDMVSNGSFVSTSGVFVSNPYVSVMDVNLQATGSAVGLKSSSAAQFAANNPAIYGYTNTSNMISKLDTFRAVAGGIKVRVQLPELSRTGTAYFAPFACVDLVPGVNMLNNNSMAATSAAASMIVGGKPINLVGSPGIIELPGAFEMSLSEMGGRDVVLPFRPISSAADLFRNSDPSVTYSSTYNIADEVTENVSFGTIGSTDPRECTSSAGWTGWIVVVNGYGVLTPGTPVCDVEYAMHYEGSEALATTSVGTIAISGGPPPPCNVSAKMRILDSIAKLPWADVIEAGADHFGVSSAYRLMKGRKRKP